MQASTIAILEADPDHSPFLARVILSASRSHLGRGPFDIALRLGDEEVLEFLEWMTLSEFICNCHYSKFIIAECAGELVGALSAYDPGESDIQPLGAAVLDAYSGLGYDEADLPSVLGRLEAVQRCLPPAQRGTWIVEWVAVEKAHRGQGIVGHLLQKILASGVERSLLRSQVSTYLGNQAAISAYEKAGFCIDRERHDSDLQALLAVPGMVTMLRELP